MQTTDARSERCRDVRLDFVAFCLLLVFAAGRADAQWAQFRGPNGAGVGASAGYPVEFSPAGNMAWKTPVPYGQSSPVVVGDHVLFGSYDQHFYAVNARTGAIHWKLETNGPVHATAAVADGIAYITGCDEIFRAIRVSDGKEVFTVPSGAYTGASPALVGTVAYYGTFNNDVLAVDLAAKKILWRYTHPERQFPYASSAAVHEGKVVVGGRDKMVHGIDAKTGKSLWTFTTRSRVESSPVITGGRVYVGGNDGKFYVLDVNTGAKVWEFEAGAPMSASPAVAGGSLVIGTQDGRLFCFR